MIKGVKPNPNSNFKQGFYSPKNKDKYIGDPDNIIYRSSLEFRFCKLCDLNDSILAWISEPSRSPFPIVYDNPIKKRKAHYYPDFFIKQKKTKSEKTKIHKIVVEVKPSEYLKRPKRPSKYASRKSFRNYKIKLQKYMVNLAKYKAAERFCERRGLIYMFITEKFFEKHRHLV